MDLGINYMQVLMYIDGGNCLAGSWILGIV